MQDQNMSTSSLPFRVLAFLLLLILLLPVLVRDGMFMDGIQYACVSKNLATGKSSFWEPYLGPTWNKNDNPAFLEHPPLVYGIQAIFFKILGESGLTERIYSLTMALVSGLLLAMTWRLVHRNNRLAALDWFPVMLWIMIPVVFWSYQNNLQENTMSVFTLLAIFFILKSSLSVGYITLLHAIIAGIALFCATLSKGLPGLFPLAAPLLLWISTRKIGFKRAVWQTMILLGVVLLAYWIVLRNPQAYQNMKFWLIQRVFNRMEHDPTTTYRLDSLWRTFTELLPSMAVAFVIILLTRKDSRRHQYPTDRYPWFFALLGLSATLPLMFSMVQKGFYLVPAFPYFALALALLSAPYAYILQSRILGRSRTRLILITVNMVMLTGLLITTLHGFGKPHRENESLHDVYQLGTVIPRQSTIRTDEPSYHDWAFQLYLLRYFDISFNPADTGNIYYLRSSPLNPDIPGYKQVMLPMKQHYLYRKTR